MLCRVRYKIQLYLNVKFNVSTFQEDLDQNLAPEQVKFSDLDSLVSEKLPGSGSPERTPNSGQKPKFRDHTVSAVLWGLLLS